MEMNTSSTISLPHDTINIIFEFAQPGSEETNVNGDGIMSERTGDQVIDLVHNPPGSHGDPAVPAQRSSTNDINCFNRSAATQETLCSDDAQKTSIETSKSNVPQLSISNPQQPWISNSLQPSISCPPQLPTMWIGNKQVVQRVYVQMPVQTHVCQNQKTSETRPTQERKKSNNKKADYTRITKNQAEHTQRTEMQVESTPITNSTKLALLNFLKKKSVATVNEANGKSGENRIEPEIQSFEPVGQASDACNKDKTCSNQLSNIQKDLIDIPARTEGQRCPETVSITQSCSPEPVQSSQESTQSFNELTPTAVQSNNTCQPSNQKSDAIEVNDESTDKEIKQADKNCSVSPSTKENCVEVENTTPDVMLGSELTTSVQEVDVVVLPSLLQPDVSTKVVKKTKKIQKQETGVKKTKRKKPRECTECGKTFPTTSQYCQHMNIHYDRRPHKCNECGKAFRQRHHLAKHQLIHTGEKPYVCQYCNKAFISFYNRRDHERIHTGEKPCECAHCGERFRYAQAMREHEVNVHGIGKKTKNAVKEKKFYACNVCGKTFSWSSALSTHKKIHVDVWPYKCKKCSRAFKSYSNWWMHKKSHSKEKPFECDLCGQRLKRRGNLKRHILTQHDPEEAEECLKTSKEFENFRANKAKWTKK